MFFRKTVLLRPMFHKEATNIGPGHCEKDNLLRKILICISAKVKYKYYGK